MRKLMLTGVIALAMTTGVHAADQFYYTINVPNQDDGSPGFLNVRTEPKGQIVDRLTHSHRVEKYDVDTTVTVIEKKGDWWYITSSFCDEPGITGWVNRKFLVAHKATDACGC
jgi:hypothetical protein